MVLPTIDRGLIFRDDALVAPNWFAINSANVTVGTITSDGDTLTVPVTFSSAVNGNFGGVSKAAFPGGILTNTYPRVRVRHNDSGGLPANVNFVLEVDYTDSSVSTFNLTKGSGVTAEPFTLLTSKTVSNVSLYLQATSSVTGSFTLFFDFVSIFKEVLTLPAVRQPISLRKRRNIVEIPILQREGGIQQDLGSMSADITVGGHLVSSTAGVGNWTNTYTADQWWYILNGLMLETATIQSDGNPTWQFFNSDQIQAKVLTTDLMLQEPTGRVQFWDYALQLKGFDILGETITNTLGAGPGQLNY
jgi:hypothetical protein